jgi:hypothetical protein
MHPELMPLLAEHLDDQQGELLPHLLLADISRWFLKNPTGSEAQAFVHWLESEFARGHSDVQELVSVSFLEMLPQPWEDTDPAHAVDDLLGPRLTGELERLRS